MKVGTSSTAERQRDWERVLAPAAKGDVAGVMFRLRKHLRSDYAVSMMALGRFFEVGGENVPIDYRAARRCYEKALAREPLVEAYLGLARLYYFGKGVDRCARTAKGYYEQCETSDEPVALHMLGYIALKDEGDAEAARKYFERASALGHLSSALRVEELRMRSGERIGTSVRWLLIAIRVMWVAIRNPHDERIRPS